jgi:aminopeptidase C
MYRALKALEKNDTVISAGGQYINAKWLIEKKGIVPEESWKPRRDFKSKAVSERMLFHLNALVGEYRIRNEQISDPEIKKKLIKDTQKKLLDYIESYSGPLPETVVYDDKIYKNPKHFLNSLPSDKREIVELIPIREALSPGLKNSRALVGKKGVTIKSADHESRKEDFETLEGHIVEALKRGEIVPLAYESNHSFMDPKTGIMSISAFYAPEGFETPPVPYRNEIGFETEMGHAVDIVGVDLDANGKVIKFKIRNSHGEQSGDRGYNHMYLDYFRNFMKRVYLRVDAPK